MVLAEWTIKRIALSLTLLLAACHAPLIPSSHAAVPSNQAKPQESKTASEEEDDFKITLAAVDPARGVILLGSTKPSRLFLFTISSDYTLTEELQLSVRDFDSFPQHAAFSPDGKWIAIDEDGGTGPSRCFVLDRRDLKPLLILNGASDYAELEFTPDSRFLTACSNGGFFALRLSDGCRTNAVIPYGKVIFDGSLEFIPWSGGRWILGTKDNRVPPELWRQSGGRITRAGHRFKRGTNVSILFARANAHRAGSAANGRSISTVKQFAPPPDSALSRFARDDYKIGFSPGGDRIALRSKKRDSLAVFSARTGDLLSTINPGGRIVSQEWSFQPGGRLILDPDGESVHFWAAATGKLILTFRPCLNRKEREAFESEWIAYTPAGLYAGSENCLKYMAVGKMLMKKDVARINRLLTEFMPHIASGRSGSER